MQVVTAPVLAPRPRRTPAAQKKDTVARAQVFTGEGETLSVRQWSVRLDMRLPTVYGHLHRGKSVGDLLASRRREFGGVIPPPKDYVLSEAHGTVDDWAYRLKMPFELFDTQLRGGLSLADISAQRQRRDYAPMSRRHTVGDEVLTGRQRADRLKTSYGRISHQLYRGKTMAQIVDGYRTGKLPRQKRASQPRLRGAARPNDAALGPPGLAEQLRPLPVPRAPADSLQPAQSFPTLDFGFAASPAAVAAGPQAVAVQELAPLALWRAPDFSAPPYDGDLLGPTSTAENFMFQPAHWAFLADGQQDLHV